MSNHNYFKLIYDEMEDSFSFLVAISCDRAMKSGRNAIRLGCFDDPKKVAQELRRMADWLDEKFD